MQWSAPVSCLTHGHGVRGSGGWGVARRGGGGGSVKQNVLEGGGSEYFVFTSWLVGAFDS